LIDKYFLKTKNQKQKMSKKVVTLGEIMLRLSTPDFKRFVQADTFDITYGGGEANVAAALCNYGLNGTFVTKVPNNAIGQSAINHIRRYGVDTQYIVRGGERLGIYFLETGASMRASQVIYDRAGASIADVNMEEFDWDKIFAGADWFHTTGITPALSDKAAALTEAALKAAKQKASQQVSILIIAKNSGAKKSKRSYVKTLPACRCLYR
jgi:2-dehydro-3-deoxygluconokinase